MAIEIDVVEEVLRICDHENVELLGIKERSYEGFAIWTTYYHGENGMYRVTTFHYDEENVGKAVKFGPAELYSSDYYHSRETFNKMN